MSDQTPPENEPTVPVPAPEPTVSLDAEQTAAVPAESAAAPETGRSGKRTAIIAAVAVLVAAVVGGGAWAAYSFFFGGGPKPEEALPASTIAVVSVDLDPSGGQKIEAIKAIRKFPDLRRNLGLDTKDDLRKFIFDEVTEDSECDGLDFADDIKPWIGDRAALAAVDLGDDTPAPAIAIQVSDQGKAKTGIAKLADCADFGDDFGYAIGEDYLIASDSTEHAKKILADGLKKPLSEDATYEKWSDEVGDAGVVNFFVAKKAAEFLGDSLDELGDSFLGSGELDGAFSEGGSGTSRGGRTADEDCTDDPFAAAKDQLENFQGLAGTIRFADAGMELAVATGGVSQLDSTANIGKRVQALPANTSLVAGFGVSDAYAEDVLDSFSCGAGPTGSDLIAEAEKELGVELPEDLQALLGSGLTLSLGGDAPESLEALDDPSALPVGLLLHGDADAARAVIAKLEKAFDVSLAEFPIAFEDDGDRLALSFSEDYAEDLLKKGSLGENDRFRETVPEAEKAAGLFYLDFDSGWRDTILDSLDEFDVDSEDRKKAEENTEPLKAFGASSWTEGTTSHFLVKLTTD